MNGQNVVSEMSINGIPYYALYFPIENERGEPITTAFLGLDTSVRTNLVTILLRIIIPVSLIDVVIAILILFAVVLRPIEKELKNENS